MKIKLEGLKGQRVLIKTYKQIKKETTKRGSYRIWANENILFNTDMKPLCGTIIQLSTQLNIAGEGYFAEKCHSTISVSMVQEVIPNCNEATAQYIDADVVYPIYKRSIMYNMVVRFTALDEGTVVVAHPVNHDHRIGHFEECWEDHTNTKLWEDVPYDPTTGLFDKQLVWCWDNNDTHARVLKFFDALHTSAYNFTGTKKGSKYQNYEAYEGDWPQWAVEAYKTLED